MRDAQNDLLESPEQAWDSWRRSGCLIDSGKEPPLVASDLLVCAVVAAGDPCIDSCARTLNPKP